MKLKYKIILPMVACVTIMVFILTGVFFYFKETITNRDLGDTTLRKINEVEDTINRQNSSIESTRKDLINQYLSKARTVAFIVKEDPGMLTSFGLIQDLANKLDVEEIHICDENGVLRWGNIKKFYGFDFRTSEQTKPFLRALSEKNFELAQEPTPRGADNVLFQYIGVARLDKPGIVQIGVKPERLQKEIEKADISNMAAHFTFSKNGYITISDKFTGKILYYKDKSLSGKKLSSLHWSGNISGNSGQFTYRKNGDKIFVNYKTLGKYLVCASVPEKDLTGQLDGFFKIFIVVFIIFILVIVALSLAINYFIKPLGVLEKEVNKVGEGDLNVTMESSSSDEVGSVVKNFKIMVSKVKVLLEQVNRASRDVGEQAKYLSESGGNSVDSSGQISIAVLHIAEEISKQTDDIAQISMLVNEFDLNLKEIYEEIEDMDKNAGEIGVRIDDNHGKLMGLIDSINSIRGLSGRVSKGVQGLTKHIEEITQITTAINDISHKTNLLALNASIEAARAGDAGRGFTVVADEVMKLAEQSISSSKYISEIVDAVYRDNNIVIKNIKDVEEELKNQVCLTDETLISYEEIKKIIVDIVSKINNVSSSIKGIIADEATIDARINKASVASQQVSASAEEISSSAEEMNSSATKLLEIVDNLNGSVRILEENLSKFKL